MTKKLLTLLFALAIVLISTTTVAAVENDFNMDINISMVGDDYVVTIVDDPYYKNHKPTIFVNTEFEGNVYVYDENDNSIKCTNIDGEVDFKVVKGGTYTVTQTKRSSSKPIKYVIPPTGVN